LKLSQNDKQEIFMPDVFIFDAIRTPRGKGKASGSLYEVKPIELIASLLRSLASRNQIPTEQVDDVLLGCVTPVGDQGYNIAKGALLHAGWHESVPGLQLNRLCASGLEGVNLGAAKVAAGWSRLIVAGGVESMSRVPMGSDGGALLFDPEILAAIRYVPQGISADLIATLEGFDREAVDAYALQSHQRAAHARENGYFASSLVPVFDRNGLLILDKDETIRPDTSMEQLGTLRPAFAKEGAQGFDAMALGKYPEIEQIRHVHTAGNSSGIVDGASLVLIGSEAAGKELGLKPRARIRATATVSTEPTIMLTGPAPASRKALEMAGMSVKDIDLWEMNEAFAAAVLKFQKDLDLDMGVVNVNGGAIAMGHPLGATGAMLLGTLLDELERQDATTGLVTLCVGGGMGVATIIERV
jgi:acetyl-CoA C-acetyltransferase